MLLMFIPIGITIDVSEKVNKMIENHVPFKAIAQYYVDFTIYFANLLFPIFSSRKELLKYLYSLDQTSSTGLLSLVYLAPLPLL